jgi:hypothetical protein
MEKSADIIISVFNRAETLTSFKAPNPVNFNLLESDKNEVASYLEYRASKKLKELIGQTSETYQNHPSKQIEEQLANQQVNTSNIPSINVPIFNQEIPAYSSSPLEILSKSLGIPTLNSSEKKPENDASINASIIIH